MGQNTEEINGFDKMPVCGSVLETHFLMIPVPSVRSLIPQGWCWADPFAGGV